MTESAFKHEANGAPEGEPAAKVAATAAGGEEKDIIMVTGGSGLVGQAIRMYVEKNKKGNEEWIYLSSKDGDLRVRSETDAIFAKYKPTHVIHLAAKVGGLFANMAQKVRSNTVDNYRFIVNFLLLLPFLFLLLLYWHSYIHGMEVLPFVVYGLRWGILSLHNYSADENDSMTLSGRWLSVRSDDLVQLIQYMGHQ